MNDGKIERVCAILGSVAEGFGPDSEEGLAIRDAALAYMVVQGHKELKESYEKLRLAGGAPLTEEMKAKLRSVGIEPDG